MLSRIRREDSTAIGRVNCWTLQYVLVATPVRFHALVRAGRESRYHIIHLIIHDSISDYKKNKVVWSSMGVGTSSTAGAALSTDDI